MKKSSLCAFAVLAFAGSATVASASTVYFSSGIRDTNFNGGEFISNLSNGNSYRSLSGFAATLYSNAIGSFSTTDNAPLDNPMFRNIRVLNPFRVNADGSITHFQSQIILIPLPTASGLALAGLALVGGIRRRK